MGTPSVYQGLDEVVKVYKSGVGHYPPLLGPVHGGQYRHPLISEVLLKLLMRVQLQKVSCALLCALIRIQILLILILVVLLDRVRRGV